ncbi:hypothetical protein ABL78_8309 [Leptomonas seymouri]|uniref:Uncharacterized protein n=1 Tax=Leptomonas seymouri TaxID=5684 RepID=A0A0N1HYD8_LEPSE|nr:hypothetical protein ABL78_8309 [Leptomonas seymouri]|eukprot:KPI82678.1 hypothetical protein ABL78_8309 [Leptomonas seymouri]
MKEGSHDMNFTTRMPDRNSFVAFKRASVTVAFSLKALYISCVSLFCSGRDKAKPSTPISAGHPTKLYSRAAPPMSCSGDPTRAQIQYTKSFALCASLLTMLTSRPGFIVGSAMALSEIVRAFSKIIAASVHLLEAAVRPHIW